jgi:hypothetical protein
MILPFWVLWTIFHWKNLRFNYTNERMCWFRLKHLKINKNNIKDKLFKKVILRCKKIELALNQHLESKQQYSPIPVKNWSSASECINVWIDECVKVVNMDTTTWYYLLGVFFVFFKVMYFFIATPYINVNYDKNLNIFKSQVF